MDDRPSSATSDAEGTSRTRALFERLANTDHRRRLTADRIFRQLRKEDEARERARQEEAR